MMINENKISRKKLTNTLAKELINASRPFGNYLKRKAKHTAFLPLASSQRHFFHGKKTKFQGITKLVLMLLKTNLAS